ncbi:hypothetical protein F5B18DRAFT_638742 [Nemania serpens]|nr:hypothetical protein F5B18DRAFT_638742 [Nemania serpens]
MVLLGLVVFGLATIISWLLILVILARSGGVSICIIATPGGMCAWVMIRSATVRAE